MHNSQPIHFRPGMTPRERRIMTCCYLYGVRAPELIAPPENGHFVATMARPSRRQRIAAWWSDSRQAIVRDVALTLVFIAAFVLLNWVIDALLWAVDRIGA